MAHRYMSVVSAKKNGFNNLKKVRYEDTKNQLAE